MAWPGGLLALVFGLAAAADAVALSVRDIRIGAHADRTRVVLEADAALAYHVFMLADPHRIVVDLPALRWDVPDDRARGRGGLIQGLRFGAFKPGQSRFVLDLVRPAHLFEHRLLPPDGRHGYRLVLDLRPANRAQFLAQIQQAAVAAAPHGGPPLPPRKPAQRQSRSRTIMIDPGHGGVDPGAIGANGSYEKWITLRFARELRRQLLATRRYNVKLTRERDIFVPLRERVRLAQRAGADLFLSLHADSIQNPRIRGSAIYTLSEKASDKEAAALARHANSADVIAGLDLRHQDNDVASILIDLTQRETMNHSASFANMLVPEIGRRATLRRRPHRFAGFMVLKAPDVPSVLIELGFLSNPEEERRLARPETRRAFAKAIVASVDRFFAVRRP